MPVDLKPKQDEGLPFMVKVRLIKAFLGLLCMVFGASMLWDVGGAILALGIWLTVIG